MRATAIFLILAFSLICLSCSSSSSGPEPGTPGFYWASAKQSFSTGDYLKTTENLDRAMKGSEYMAKALPWSMVVDTGLIRGYSNLADDFEQGARANRTNPGFFRKETSNDRRFARGLTLQLAEKFRDFQKTKDDPVTLSFPFPSGSQATPPLMGKVVQGIIPQPSEVEDAQKLALARAMILSTSAAAGAGEDSSKAQAMFKSGDVQVPRATFLTAMARGLSDSADLYGSKKLDEPERARMFAESALQALKGVPDSKEVKALNERIQKTLKPLKKST